jgi:hypothetical protein
MTDAFPTAAQCVPVGALVLSTLAHLQRWAPEHLSTFGDLPLAGVALGEAVMGPWATAAQAQQTVRTCAWTYAIDNHVERDVTSLAELDDLFDRCAAVVRTGQRDDSHPLLACLSGWQHDLARHPDYPALAALWERKFADGLRAMRYDWVVGRAREEGAASVSNIEEYLANADSILVWLVHLPRWIVYGGAELVDHLDVLIPAMDDVTVATRLANDLATYAWEKDEKGQNNILMYGASPDWVRAEIAARMASVRQRLAPLTDRGFLPAVGVVRLAEWSVGIYLVTDLRVGSDQISQPTQRSGV